MYKEKKSQKFIHLDTGIECYMSLRQVKQKVWSLHKKAN